MATIFFSRGRISMFTEQNMLMRQELCEPAMYSSVMRAIAREQTDIEVTDSTCFASARQAAATAGRLSSSL